MPNIVVHSVRAPVRPHAIFVSAGDRETFASYALDNLADDFDILIFFYGSSGAKEERFRKDARLFAAGAGTKFMSLKEICSQQCDLLSRYETVWVCDDDLVLEHGDCRLLPAACVALNIPVLSPAHSRKGKISHPITAPRLGRHVLRYTSFIEMTAPLFATPALAKFLDAYEATPGGWAEDWWFLNVLGADRHAVAAIVDAVTFINPFDAAKPGGYSEIEQVGKLDALRQAWLASMKRYGLRQWPQRNLLYVRPDLRALAEAGATARLFRRNIKEQIQIFLTELNCRIRFYGLRKSIGRSLRNWSTYTRRSANAVLSGRGGHRGRHE